MGVFSKIFSMFRGRSEATEKRLQKIVSQDARNRDLNAQRLASAGNARAETQRINARLERVAGTTRKILEADRHAEDRQQQRDPEYRFTHLGELVDTPQSSNVRTIQYRMAENVLVVSFKDGSVYGYKPVFVQEAASLFRSSSKGTWIWDNLRIRGTKLGHRKDYFLLVEGFVGQRVWNRSEEAADVHGRKASWDSGQPDPFSNVGRYEKPWPDTNQGKRRKKEKR